MAISPHWFYPYGPFSRPLQGGAGQSSRAEEASDRGRLRVESDPVIVGGQRAVFAALVGIWTAANLLFWGWWLQPKHVETGWLFALFSAAFFYEVSFLPTMYLYFVGRMRRPRLVSAPAGLRVALITLCVPSSETIDVIERQLAALAAVRYPHDSWILDEGGDPRVRAAAERHGVRYFTRKNVARYNQPAPPFKAKTKAGNVNAWLDAHGHDYEFFVQLDIDHLPEVDYLDRVLGYFRDPVVAWVQGPSLYSNLTNWVARGAAEQELVLQGPLQQGFFGNSESPFIIGSHCTYRTRAIKEIDGFQPTRAEDHLDTVMLAARGYRGVFVPEPLAWGAGPDTFETYLRQQFAWAFSMMQVLFMYTPRCIWKYSPLQAIQFLFAQTWYTCWSTTMFVLFMMPLIILVTDLRPAHVSFAHFMAAFMPVGAVAFGIWWWTRAWHLPRGLGLSWRGIVLHVARWPIVFWALLNIVANIKHPYMITPKGESGGLPRFSLRSQAIYLAAAAVSLVAIWLYLARGREDGAEGHVFFALLGVFYMLGVVATNVVLDFVDLRRRGVALLLALRLRLVPAVAFLTTVVLVMGTAGASSDRIVEAAMWTEYPLPAGQIEVAGAKKAREALLAVADEVRPAPAPLQILTDVLQVPLSLVAPTALRPTPPPKPQPQVVPLPDDRLFFGAYDPWLTHVHERMDVEHWYIRQDDPRALVGALAHARDRRTPMITIEPFPSRRQRTPALDAIVAGEKDAEVAELARVVRDAQPQLVLVRWAHEMDLSGLYPWSANHPELYKAAYHRVVNIFRQTGAHNVRWVWSPAGDSSMMSFYPGDDVVDFVGLTVLADTGWDAQWGLPRRSFAQILRERYDLVAQLDKPVIVAEAGVSGTVDEQVTWLSQIPKDLPGFPLLQGVIYFNDQNAPNNRLVEQPNWTLSSQAFETFKSAMRGAIAHHAALDAKAVTD